MASATRRCVSVSSFVMGFSSVSIFRADLPPPEAPLADRSTRNPIIGRVSRRGLPTSGRDTSTGALFRSSSAAAYAA